MKTRLLLLSGALLLLSLFAWKRLTTNVSQQQEGAPLEGLLDPELVNQVIALEQQRKLLDQTLWKDEKEAQALEAKYIQLWGSLVNAPPSTPLQPLQALLPRHVSFPSPGTFQSLPHQILHHRFSSTPDLPPLFDSWDTFLAFSQSHPHQVEQLDLRLRQYHFTPSFSTATFHFSAHLLHPDNQTRIILRGTFQCEWNSDSPSLAPFSPDHLLISSLELLQSTPSSPYYTKDLSQEILPGPKTSFIDPVLLHHFPQQTSPSILLLGANQAVQRTSNGTYHLSPLTTHSLPLITTGALLDLTQDGHADLLAVNSNGLYLYPGTGSLPFQSTPQLLFQAPIPFDYAQVLTAGDIDQDGDLDLWIGQYKLPYLKGQMPTPFYNANDGNPFYLLENLGRLEFKDVTSQSGLTPKRLRRIYSASFVDLNQDHLLDLVPVSDFAGADVFLNQGQGRFEDVSTSWLPPIPAFGMAHGFADWNHDGTPDLYVLGMDSPVADRLKDLLPPGVSPDHAHLRHLITQGNQFFLQTSNHFTPAPFHSTLAKTGWTWGTQAFDADNDGDLDLYLANGHESKQTPLDYEAEFWCHDVFVGTSKPSRVPELYFLSKLNQLRGGPNGRSYRGYEKNPFYLNQGQNQFVEIAYLLGLSLEEDSRNVLTADLDHDGVLEILVTTFQTWPRPKQTLEIFRRTSIPTENQWIEVHLQEAPHSHSPWGAKVTLYQQINEAPIPIESQHHVLGTSYRSQNSSVLHFGLGSGVTNLYLQVNWPNATQTEVPLHPLKPLNQRIVVSPPRLE